MTTFRVQEFPDMHDVIVFSTDWDFDDWRRLGSWEEAWEFFAGIAKPFDTVHVLPPVTGQRDNSYLAPIYIREEDIR